MGAGFGRPSWSGVFLAPFVVLLLLMVNAGGMPAGQARGPSGSVSSSPTTPHWKNLTKSSLGPIVAEASMTYNWQDGFLLLFGGVNYVGWQTNSTWAYYGNTWHNISTVHAPSPRDEAAMAYDPVDHDVVLFGGTNSTNIGLSDTWTFRGGAWTQMHPAISPSGRGGASMVFDSPLEKMLMFGGTSDFACGCAVTGNEWIYASGNWTQRNPSSLPTQTVYTSGMSYDHSSKTAVVFGGWDPALGDLNTTWVLSGHNWTTVPTPTGLTPRQGSGMGFDPKLNETILFGGWDFGFVKDTWAYTSAGWSPIKIPGPSSRAWGTMAWDPVSGGMILYGGSTGAHPIDETWVLR